MFVLNSARVDASDAPPLRCDQIWKMDIQNDWELDSKLGEESIVLSYTSTYTKLHPLQYIVVLKEAILCQNVVMTRQQKKGSKNKKNRMANANTQCMPADSLSPNALRMFKPARDEPTKQRHGYLKRLSSFQCQHLHKHKYMLFPVAA